MIKKSLILLLVFCLACKNQKQQNLTVSTGTETTIIYKDSVESINVYVDSTKTTLLPLGSPFVKYNFDKNVITIDEKENPISNEVTIKIDSILKTIYEQVEVSTDEVISSEGGINPMYGRESIYIDSKTKNFEQIYTLPNRYGLNIYIEKVAKKQNPNNRTEQQFCFSIYKNNVLINRYNIGYVYYGDLVESYKVWFVDNNYFIHNRLIGVVSGNSDTYIGKLHTYSLTQKGDLIRYFEIENGEFKDQEETGKIINHLKEGIWLERPTNYLINENEAYVIANYKEGKPTGTWQYFDLVNNSEKGSKLLMTEEYSDNGELLKREILKD